MSQPTPPLPHILDLRHTPHVLVWIDDRHTIVKPYTPPGTPPLSPQIIIELLYDAIKAVQQTIN